MIPKEISEKCKVLELHEKRTFEGSYIELVFNNKDNDKVNEISTSVLGPATKPPGTKPTKQDLQVTKEYGSIAANQTLFSKEINGTTVMAMLWPWGDGTHTTIKVAG